MITLDVQACRCRRKNDTASSDKKMAGALIVETLYEKDAAAVGAELARQFPQGDIGVFRVLCHIRKTIYEALLPLAETIARRLIARRETIAIANPRPAALSPQPCWRSGRLGLLSRRRGGLHQGVTRGLARHRRRRDARLRRQKPTRCCWRGACANGTARSGVSPKPAPPDRPATATAIRPATPAWRFRVLLSPVLPARDHAAHRQRRAAGEHRCLPKRALELLVEVIPAA